MAQRVDVNATLRALRRLVVRALPENIELELALSDGPLDVKVDKSRFEAALINLVVNARDAMPRGGKIAVATSLEQSPTGVRSACVSVTDDGDGMSPEVHARAFDPFFTTKPPGRGTGLGLPAVQAFALAAGGHLSIRSQPEHGTEVRVYLPRDEGAAEPALLGVGSGKFRGGTEKIVLVDEDETVRRSMRVVLEELGYRVVESPSRNVVFQLVEGGDVDLVVVDRALRGTSGIHLARSILAVAPSTRVLVLDGHLEQVFEEDAPGDLPFLPKPVDRIAFLQKVRSVLDARSGSRATD